MANFKNFIEYTKNWTDKKVIKDMKSFVKKFMSHKAQELIAKTKLRTPVDTGALQSAWKAGSVKSKTNKYEVEITNNQEYASFVEYGTIQREWKWKNGAFMLTKSLNEIEQNINKDFSIQFTKYLNDKGIGK